MQQISASVVYTMFPSYLIDIALLQFLYPISLLFPLKQIFFGMIFVTERVGTLRFRKSYEAYRIAIDPLHGSRSETIIGPDFEKIENLQLLMKCFFNES